MNDREQTKSNPVLDVASQMACHEQSVKILSSARPLLHILMCDLNTAIMPLSLTQQKESLRLLLASVSHRNILAS